MYVCMGASMFKYAFITRDACEHECTIAHTVYTLHAE